MTRIYLFPGQGSQKVGMGAELFDAFPSEVQQADAILGYSVRKLCLEDTSGQLDQTQFTQPALFVVNALTYLRVTQETGQRPDFVAGHSLGEYDALFAAGAFDFATGVRLVQKRGELMSQARGGAMAAILGLAEEPLRQVLAQPQFTSIDVANFNSPSQVVISGPGDALEQVKPALEAAGAKRVILLKVSAAFHSRYMKPASEEFRTFLDGIEFLPLQIPVIANVTALPYAESDVRSNLASQIASPVRWTESINYLLRLPEPEFQEVGPGQVLTGLIRQIKAAFKP